jgi:hypothetical protein
MIVSTETAKFGSSGCLDGIHSTGVAEVKRRSVMMEGSAPRALLRRESLQADLDCWAERG